MRYKACLFDMNGVLVDDEHLQEEAFRKTLASLDYNLTHDDYQTYFIGKTDQKGFEDFFVAQEASYDISKLMTQKSIEYKKLAKEELASYEGVRDFIQALGDHRIKLGVVTSSTRPEAETVLASLGIWESFSSIVTAEDITRSKPDPEGYLLGASSLGVLPGECMVIEDAPSGIAAASAAGTFVIAVSNTHPKDELVGADIIVERLSPAVLDDLI